VVEITGWHGRMTPRDYAALTPLIWEHVNPYGRFDVDMNARLVTRLLGLTLVGTPSPSTSDRGQRAAAIEHFGSMRLLIRF